MEFRRRKRRRRSSARSGGGTGKVIVTLVLIALVVYLISASAAGTWIAQNVIAPVFAAFDNMGKEGSAARTPSATAAPTAASGDGQAQTVTEEVSVPAMECFALQMGVYTNEDNARAEAEVLQKRGAGGYILNDNGQYRVLAAAYADQTSLNQVREQLTAEGMESASFTFTAPVSTLRITATQTQLTRIKDGIAALDQIQKDMGAASLAFDKEKQEVSEGLSKAAVLKQQLSDAKSAFLADETDGNEVLLDVADCFEAYEDALTDLAAHQTNSFVDFSSRMKYTHLCIADAYAKLAQQVSATGT